MSGASEPFSALPRVADHELLRPIGKGSYGEVWLARNVMGAWRAVKVVARSSFDSDRPFRREFDGIQRYEPVSRAGDGLVSILHAGLDAATGSFYYVMELADPDGQNVSGTEELDVAAYQPRTLRSDLKRLGRLTVEECVELGLSLAAGLGHLHRHGLVHRDLKPMNVVFIQGRARLADLGLVGDVRAARTFVGTEGYIPPEGPGAPSADLYALGKVLYQAATGLSPDEFPNPPADWLTGEVPHEKLELHEIILKACESDLARRYKSAAEMHSDLSLMRSGQSVRRARRLERRVLNLRRLGVAAGAGLALALFATLLIGYRASVERENARRSDSLRNRAELAEQDARVQLAEAQLARAALERRSGLAGQRERALDLLREAAAHSTNRAGLRSEAIAALALTDIRERARAETDAAPEIVEARQFWPAIDDGLTRYVRPHPDGSVRVHAWKDDRELSVLEGAGPKTLAAPFSSDGRLVSGQSEDEAVVWETATGRKVFSRVMPGLTGVDMTPDGRFVALRPPGSILHLFHVADGSGAGAIDQHFAPGYYWFSPDSSELVSHGAGSCEIQRFSVPAGARLGVYLLPLPVCPTYVVWSPDSRGLLICGNDFRGYYVRLDDARVRAVRLEGHTAEISGAAFHPALPLALTSSWDGSSRLWDLRTGRALARMDRGGYEIRWTKDNRIGWREQQGASRWRLAEFEAVLPAGVALLMEPAPYEGLNFRKGPWDGVFAANGRVFATASYDGVRVFSSGSDGGLASLLLDAGAARWVWPAPQGGGLWCSTARGIQEFSLRHEGDVLSVVPGRRFPQLAGELSLASDRTGPEILALAGRTVRSLGAEDAPAAGRLERDARILALSPDGRHALTAGLSETVTLWQREPWKKLRDSPGAVSAHAVFAPDGESFLVAGSEVARRERVSDGKVLWSVPRSATALGGVVAVSPNGRLAAASSAPQEVALLDAENGEVVAHLRPPESGLISSLAFSPDGARLGVTTQNHFSHLWNLAELARQIRALGLDWPAGAFAEIPPASPPLSLRLGPASRAADGPGRPVNLRPWANFSLRDFSSSQPDNSLGGLATGTLRSQGVEFDVQGIIKIGGTETDTGLPRKVGGIQTGARARRIHFLHAAAWNGESRAMIGRYTLLYRSGASEVIPLVDGVNIHDWWIPPGADPPGLTVAWRGGNPVASAAGMDVALFHFVWENPRPDDVIESISVESGTDRRVPFVAGITLE